MRSTNQTDVRLTVATKDRITLQLNSDDPLSVSSPPEPTEPQISPRTFAQLPIPKFQVPNEIELLQQQFSLWNESTGFQRFTGLLIIVKTSLYKGFKDLIFHNENC